MDIAHLVASLPVQKYPPPDVPRDFVCRHTFEPSDVGQALPDNVRKKPLTSRERTQILSEKPGTLCDNDIVVNSVVVVVVVLTISL